MKEVFVLRNLECVKVVTHPKRIDILNAFKSSPLSAKKLANILGEPHAKINYHIKNLYKIGILELVEEKVKSGIVEKYYYPKAKNIVIDKNVINLYLDNQNEGELINKFGELSETFYKNIEDNREEDSVIIHDSMLLTKEEVEKLNETMKLKIKELVSNREESNLDKKYHTSIISMHNLRNKEISQ